MSKDFYLTLKAFRQFEDFTLAENYRPLPDDWMIVVADIKNSTAAIEKGQYKEVNLIGAASITQSMQSMNSQEIPYVFGGDGASICIPEGDCQTVSRQLGKLQKLARDNFGLQLRVAMIPVGEVRSRGREVLVAKLEITRGKFIALFRGGGLAEADQLAKRSDGKFSIAAVDDELNSLSGLSCRWSPVPSRKGQVVSLLVMARDGAAMGVYQDLISSFRNILGGDISESNPVINNLVNYKSIRQALADEARYHRSCFSISFLTRVIDIILAVLIFKYGINPIRPFFNAKAYTDTISEHSDYRKFDDTLRLIMDCTEKELADLKSLLEQGYRDGLLYYGLHASGEALMTCFVESTAQGAHLHFIDGGDGGLAMASRQLKLQLNPG